jgi:hypothetical protein
MCDVTNYRLKTKMSTIVNLHNYNKYKTKLNIGVWDEKTADQYKCSKIL